MKKQQEEKDRKAAKKEKAADSLAQNEEIVEVDETRNPASLVFIGHVDAGKSTICGNLMLTMGVIDQRTVTKFKEEAKEKNRESWWLAYAMDESDQERARGKTVEMGKANFDTKQKRLTIFDAPGHKNYVPNMIMGAALADYGALVISAKKGEFESGFDADGQTREHIQLAKSLGIYRLIIVVNKMDEPSVKWSEARYTEIVTALKPFLSQCGYDPEKECQFVPASGLSGENIFARAPAGTCNWYKDGRSLIEILDDFPLPPRDENAPLRVPVLDKMTDKGVIVFGKVESGTVKLGDGLKIMPSGTLCQVVTIYDSKDQCVKYAKPGENVKLRISVDGEEKVNKGDVICLRDQTPVQVTELFEAEMQLMELIKYKPILSKGYQCILHLHTVADDATVKEILVTYDKNERGEEVEKQKPQFAKSFSRIICRIQTRIPISLEKHDVMP
jgi:peptide chain release factor subunit 3